MYLIETDNELASREGGYDNISVPYLPTNPSLDLLKFLNQVQAGAVSADCIFINYHNYVNYHRLIIIISWWIIVDLWFELF